MTKKAIMGRSATFEVLDEASGTWKPVSGIGGQMTYAVTADAEPIPTTRKKKKDQCEPSAAQREIEHIAEVQLAAQLRSLQASTPEDQLLGDAAHVIDRLIGAVSASEDTYPPCDCGKEHAPVDDMRAPTCASQRTYGWWARAARREYRRAELLRAHLVASIPEGERASEETMKILRSTGERYMGSWIDDDDLPF